MIEVARHKFFISISQNPFNVLLATLLTASLISVIEVSRLASKVRSTTDTFGVGTRTANPSNFPSSSGRTKPTALAAPVVVVSYSNLRHVRGIGHYALYQYRLVTSIAMYGSHKPTFYTYYFMQNFCYRSQTICST